MTTCWSEPHDERTDGGRRVELAAERHQTAVRAAASTNPGQPVRTAGRASRTRTPTLSRLPRSTARGRARGARAAGDRSAHQRRALTTRQNVGRVRLPPGADGLADADE